MGLRELRKQKGMSQQELAEKLGVGQPTIWSWETERTKPAPYYMQQIENIFDTPKEVIFLKAFTTK